MVIVPDLAAPVLAVMLLGHCAVAGTAGAAGNRNPGVITYRRPGATCSCRYRHSLTGGGAICMRPDGRVDGISATVGLCNC